MGTELMKRRAIYAAETLRDSAVLTFKQFFPLLGAWALTVAVPVGVLFFGIMAAMMADRMAGFREGGFATLAVLVSGIAVLGALFAGWIVISLKVARGLACKMSDLIRPVPQIMSAFVVLLITTSLVGIGSFLIIPGALLFLKWQLAPYYVVDRGYGPIQALKQSWSDTDRIFWPLAILDLIFLGLSSASGFTLIGPAICNMALAVASAIVYNKWLTDENNPEFAKDAAMIEQRDTKLLP